MVSRAYRGCVYLATNTINGRAYIGKTVSGLASRIITHHHAAKSGRKVPLCAAIRRYGRAAFQWRELFVSDDESALLAAEVALIADYRAAGYALYNLTPGGEGLSLPCTDDRRRKVSASMKGRIFSPEHLARLREAARGKPKSREHVEKVRQTKIGRKLPPWSAERRAKCAATWAAKRAARLNG